MRWPHRQVEAILRLNTHLQQRQVKAMASGGEELVSFYTHILENSELLLKLSKAAARAANAKTAKRARDQPGGASISSSHRSLGTQGAKTAHPSAHGQGVHQGGPSADAAASACASVRQEEISSQIVHTMHQPQHEQAHKETAAFSVTPDDMAQDGQMAAHFALPPMFHGGFGMGAPDMQNPLVGLQQQQQEQQLLQLQVIERPQAYQPVVERPQADGAWSTLMTHPLQRGMVNMVAAQQQQKQQQQHLRQTQAGLQSQVAAAAPQQQGKMIELATEKILLEQQLQQLQQLQQQQLAIIHGMCHNQTALVAQPVTVTTSSEIQETFATKRRCVESPVADKKVADELAAVQAMRLLTAAKAK